MKVAVAGTGPAAQYLIEELSAADHEVVVLTRNTKPNNPFEQRQTNYSISSLIGVLEDIDVLVPTVADFENPHVATKVTLNMLEACKQSSKCKTFIPSEWTLNVEECPEQPIFLAEANHTLHKALKNESSIRWTILYNSWFTDYVVPKKHRYLCDVGEAWPMDHETKTFTIYGPGTQLVDLTSVRDVAKAVAVLLNSHEPWEPYIYMSGEQLTWNELFTIMKGWGPEWKSQNKTLAATVQQVVDKRSLESVLFAHFELESYAGALEFSKEKVQIHREKYFHGVHFRTVKEILTAAKEHPDRIVQV